MHSAVDLASDASSGVGGADARTVHLRSGGTSVILSIGFGNVPRIVHWGADLGELDDAALESMRVASIPQAVSGGLDQPSELTILPQNSDGWLATPGLEGHRSGRDFSPGFSTVGADVSERSATIRLTDDDAQLAARLELEVTSSGLLRQRILLTNTGASTYALEALTTTFPVPETAREILDTTGRHLRERSPQRHGFTVGRHLRESRRGRPGADATLVIAAGSSGFGFERGLVHAVHVAWSGNHRLSAERTNTSDSLIQAGELFLPGEIVLEPQESYRTPWALGSWGNGLNELQSRFHRYLRERPVHPTTPRPVTLNTWEAVYFDHDIDRLIALADTAADLGVERFVLDDGWFLGRRDDTAGLGDWTVDPAIWPLGLSPLVDRVTASGMQFGLWVEPEMINPDSELARSHPEWILGVHDRTSVSGRNQQVLDIAHPDAWTHLLERLDDLLNQYPISYLKWDHNRDLIEPGDRATGRPAVHAQVEALYRLLDELVLRHPGLEIESCASGGARVDLGILDHTQRIWASDCIDPIERLQIQKYTGLVAPPELLGSHVASRVSHSTGRAHSLDLRAGVAMFGHFGIEWDIADLSVSESTRLGAWIDAYKDARDLVATGTAVYADRPDDESDLRGMVAADASRALFAYTQVRSTIANPPGRITFPGLDPDLTYRLTLAAPLTAVPGPGRTPLAWAEAPLTMTGHQFAVVGVQAPAMDPEQQVLLEFRAKT